MWFQKRILLASRSRGFHLVTSEIIGQLPELAQINIGLSHIFLQHTSASLTINENADSDVRIDLENYFTRLAPENNKDYSHIVEGPDDMPAHIKTVIVGCSLSIPVKNGQLCLGIWQGIYLCEHRNHAGKRSLIVTVHGE